MTTTAALYRDQIQALVGLPTLPTIAMEIQQIMRDDQLSVSQTVPILEQDPSLALKILRVANSAYYGLKEPVESLRHAVVVLGMRELAGVALGFSILKVMSREEENLHGLSWKRFWEHSIAVAHLTEFLDTKLGIHSLHSAYSLGLLHDIGKLVLFRLDSGLYREVRELYLGSEGMSDGEAERCLFGIDHAEAGALLAEQWGLPEAIQISLRYHHVPDQVEDPDHRKVAALVNLADYVADVRGMHFDTRMLRHAEEVPTGWELLGEEHPQLRTRGFEEFLLDMDQHWGTIREMISLLDI